MSTGPSYRVIVVPDRNALNNLLSGRTGDLRRVMAGFSGRITRNARNLAAARLNKGTNLSPNTGAYARSLHTRFTSADEFQLRSDVPYAATLELGSRPHGIVGTPLLVWPPSRSNTGDWVATPAVAHPGNRQPYRIMTDAVIETAKEIGL